MATSFTRTREQLAQKVLRKLGAIGVGETPSADDAALVYEAMDLRLKELHRLGVLWWKVSGATTDVTLVANTVTASITPTDFLFPVSMALRIGSDDYPMDIIGHREYQAIQDKTTTGEPAKVFIDGSTCRFYPVPKSNYTAKLTYEKIADDTAASTRPDMKVEMLRALSTIVAYDLVDEYDLLSDSQIARLEVQAERALRDIRALNVERVDATQVTPDYY